MRTQDELLRAFKVSQPAAQRYIVRQLERLPVAFDSDELIGTLERERPRAPAEVKELICLGLGTMLLRRIREQAPGGKEDGRSKPSLWTLHQIRVEDLAKELAATAEPRESVADVNLEVVLRTAFHCLSESLDCLYRTAAGGDNQLKREDAVRCLGRCPTARAVQTLTPLTGNSALAALAAGSLARLEAREADQALMAASRTSPDSAGAAGVLLGLRDRPSQEALQVLGRAATSKTAAVRQNAAIALEGYAGLEPLALLERLAADPDEWTCIHTLESAGRLRKPDAIGIVSNVYKRTQHPFVRMVAMKAAARMPCEPAVQLCLEAIKGPNPDIVRAVAIEGLVRLGAPKERFREFSGLLGSADSVKLASNLILALAGAERDAVNRSLKAMLASPNELSRAEAAYCLGYLDDPAALKLLRKLIDKDRSDIVRGQALLGLFHHRSSREGRDAILELLSHETAEVRVLVARMLRAREFAGDPSAANAASAGLRTETVPEVRTSLLKLLAPVVPDQARSAILEELDSNEPAALPGALDALALLSDRGLAPKAAEFLKSGEAPVRARAAHTLWALGDLRGPAALRDLLSDSYYDSFQHGCRALEELLCELTVLDRRDTRKPVLQLLREHMKTPEYAAHARGEGGGILAQQPLVTERTEDFDYASARGQWLFKEPAQEGQAMLERLDRMFESGEASLPSPSARASEFDTFTLMQTDGIGDLAGPGASEADRNNIRSLYRQAVAGDSEAETRLREFTRHADPKMREAAQKLLVRLQTDRAPAPGQQANGAIAPVPVEDVYTPGIEALLKEAVRLEASDLHLSVGYTPIFRIHGQMERSRFPVLNASHTRFLIRQLLSPEKFAAFDSAKDFDFSYSIPNVGSFRANAFHEFHGCGVVLRVVPSKIPTFEELGTPPLLRSLCREDRGLVLVTGPTGSGKSTTMAAMLSYINENRSCHVITIEDPIEFVHTPLSAKFVQREVPTHASSFARALRAALREDPDVIMVGELRDLETMELAIAAAETGHLVLSTLHTINAALTVDRMINVFPPEQQEQVRRSVSEALLAVVSQALLPRQDRPGRIAAYELLCRNPAVSNLIRENKLHLIPNVMVGCKKEGMVLLDDWLFELVGKGVISWETALARAVMKKEFTERFAARKGSRN